MIYFPPLSAFSANAEEPSEARDEDPEPEEEEVVEERPDENKSLSDHILNGKDIVGGDSIHSDMMDLDEV